MVEKVALALPGDLEYKGNGQPRFKRPLWLIFVLEDPGTDPPSPREAQAIYEERFSLEHSIRFLKHELGLTAGQFSRVEAEGRVQVWTEMVATPFWHLWALWDWLTRGNGTSPNGGGDTRLRPVWFGGWQEDF